MASQTCKLHADSCDLRSNVELAWFSFMGNVFSGPLALAMDLATDRLGSFSKSCPQAISTKNAIRNDMSHASTSRSSAC